MKFSLIYRHCTKRAVLVFLSTTLVFIIIWKWKVGNKRNSTYLNHISTQPETDEQLISSQPHTYGVNGPRDPRFYNIISEDEALAFEPCRDIRKAASAQHSRISLTGSNFKLFLIQDRSKGTYTIGETIPAVVIVHDGYGNRKSTGGDQLRATIANKMLSASAPCVVTDNKDGTHSVICEALWGGDSIISVKLAYTREIVTIIYRTRTKVLANRRLCGIYMNRKSTEESPCTPCHPNSTHLGMFTSYTKLCNITSFNSGMPFYCGKPTNEYLSCQDLQLVKMDLCEELPMTECEKTLFERGQVALKQTLKVTVANRSEDKNISVIDKPSIPCSLYNVSLGWHSRRPTGFFHGGKWHLRNCRGAQKQHYMSCLQNRRLYLFGDSTVRHWYYAVLERFECKLTSNGYMKCPKCQEESQCVNKEIDFQARWFFHALPIFTGRNWDTTHPWYSVSLRIDNIPRNERSVILIHVYAHMINFHHNVFRQKMEIIRNSVEHFLIKSRHSVVLIKAPHTFEGPVGDCRLHDYYGDVYRKILYEIFDGLHDRVILLNNRDATLAQHEKFIHPKENIINAMIDQMMSYICD